MAEYTMTFKAYLDRYALVEGEYHIPFTDYFPPFTLGNLNINFKDLFIGRNLYKEIGAETPELFSHYLTQKMRETAVTYVPKIKMYIENFERLLDRKLAVKRDEERIYNTENKNENTTKVEANDRNYLNPINGTNDKLQERDENISEGSSTDIATRTGSDKYNRDMELILPMFESNADIMKRALDIEDIYMRAIAELDVLFMGVL